MPKCDFNKGAVQLSEITFWHGCSPVKLLHIFRASFPREHLWMSASLLRSRLEILFMVLNT